jgi:hypothetical protein
MKAIEHPITSIWRKRTENCFVSNKRAHYTRLLSWSFLNGLHGFGPDSELSLKISKQHDSVITVKNIACNQIVLSLPFKLCLSSDSVRFCLTIENKHNDCVLCNEYASNSKINLVFKILKKLLSESKTPWTTYLGFLRHLVTNQSLETSDQINEIEYPPTMKTLRRKKDYVKNCFLKYKHTHLGDATFMQFSWTVSIVDSRSFLFTNDTTNYLSLLIPLVDILNHGGDIMFPFFHGPEDASLSNISCQLSPNLSSNHGLQFFAEKNISPDEELFLCYGKWSNDHFIENYGFIPLSNPWDDVLLFEDSHEIGLWWIKYLGRRLSIQRHIDGIMAIMNAINQMVNIEEIPTDIRKKFLKEQGLKILSGGRIDIRIKYALVSAWKVISSESNKSNSVVRLAEISIAIRVVQTKALFSTSLETDLITLIERTESDEDLNSLIKFLLRHTNYYSTELRNIDLNFEEFSHKLFMENNPKNRFSSPPTAFLRSRLSLLFVSFKKMSLVDTFLLLHVESSELAGFVQIFQ